MREKICYNEIMARVGTKMKNKRYQKTEAAILEVLMKSKELPTTRVLIENARISRSTLYRHHKTVPGIVPDYEKEVLEQYEGVVRKLVRRKNTQVRTICLRTLIFIMTNRRIFMILLKYDGGIVIEKMILKLKSKLKTSCCLPKNSEKMLRVYAKEVAGVIEEWGRQRFIEDELETVLSKIMYLTESMRQRLGPVNC